MRYVGRREHAALVVCLSLSRSNILEGNASVMIVCLMMVSLGMHHYDAGTTVNVTVHAPI